MKILKEQYTENDINVIFDRVSSIYCDPEGNVTEENYEKVQKYLTDYYPEIKDQIMQDLINEFGKPSKNNKQLLTEKNWNYRISNDLARRLRSSIEESDYEELKSCLIDTWKEVHDLIPDTFELYELEEKIDEIELIDPNYDDEEDVEENLDYALDDLYDFCDSMSIWIPVTELDESLKNLDDVIKNKDIAAVTELTPTMAQAYLDDKKSDEQLEEVKKETEKYLNKDHLFLGANKQPTAEVIKESYKSLKESSNCDVVHLCENIAEGLIDLFNCTGSLLSNYLSKEDIFILTEAQDIIEYLWSLYRENNNKLNEEQLPVSGKDDNWDLFTWVQEELSPTDPANDLKDREVNGKHYIGKLKRNGKFPEVTAQERYKIDDIGIDNNFNTIVYGGIDDFDFAKRVADAYDLEITDPKVENEKEGIYKVIIKTSKIVES